MGRAQQQRRELVECLEGLTEVQWAAETVCDGWDAGDVAAHLVARERNPLAAAGIMIPAAARFHDRAMAERRQLGRDRLLAELADGPTWWMVVGPLDNAQAVEDWIHHEDVRRGGAGLEPRTGEEDPGTATALWEAACRFATLTLGSISADGVIALTDGGRERRLRVGAGNRTARRTDDAPDVTVCGPVGELLLWVAGRDVARVEITGDPGLQGALASAERGI